MLLQYFFHILSLPVSLLKQEKKCVCVCVLDLIKEVLSLDDEIQKLATELYQQKSVLIMGRGYHYATCLEGALVSTCEFIIWQLDW